MVGQKNEQVTRTGRFGKQEINPKNNAEASGMRTHTTRKSVTTSAGL